MRRLTAHPRSPAHADRGGISRLALIAGYGLSLALAAWIALVSPEVWGQSESQPKSQSPKKSDSGSKNGSNGESAQALLQQAHSRLIGHRSVRTDVAEIAHLSDPPLRMTGRYLASGVKLRLEYQVTLGGGVGGSLLEVCDGERLWSLMELPGSQKVTRRDIRQILAAAERAQARPERTAAVDLALGGLPALLMSLQRSLVFDGIKQETLENQPVLILTGRWKPELAEQLGANGDPGETPAHIPDAVRLTLAADTLFPLRLTYLKRQVEGVKPLLDLRFRNVVLNGEIDEREFHFTPPDGSEPEDITRQYIQQLFPEETTGTGGESKTATPAAR